MLCKHIERKLIDFDLLSPEQIKELESHLSECSECNRIAEELHTVRQVSQSLHAPAPAADMVEHTFILCREKLREGEKSKMLSVKQLPFMTWIGLFGYLITLFLWVIPEIMDFSETRELSSRGIFAFVFLIQNLITLCMSPILLGHFQKEQKFEKINVPANGY